MIDNLPSQLASPMLIRERPALKVMLDLTVYIVGPLEQELEYLVDLYASLCPKEYMTKYKISELEYWSYVERPSLTASGRMAMKTGIRRPYMEPARKRIREGRAFEIQFWDGRALEDVRGSWSFNCRRIKLRQSGLHAFVRILLPLSEDHNILRTAAAAISNNVTFYSGHSGFVFVYDPWLKEAAFDAIYAHARRFWGVDVEDLNGTLPLMRRGIKGINWITLVGNQFLSVADVREGIDKLTATPNVTTELHQFGAMLIAGQEPVVGDQHRPDRSLDPYRAIAKALQPILLAHHPDFPGERFIKNANTVGWIQRFLDPNGWR